MRLESLRTVQWRNIEDGAFEFLPGVNIFVGENGQGKTNFLEAIQYLALGRSHRGARDDEIVRFGGEHFFVRGDGQGDAGEAFSIEAGFTPPRSKKLKIDGRPTTRLTEVTGILACVAFGPEDAELARGGPEHRRRFVDYGLAETSRSSLQVLGDYRRVQQQRTALLRAEKQPQVLGREIEAWDDELIGLGCEVVRRRAEVLVALAPLASEFYGTLTGGLSMQLRYAVHVLGQDLAVEPELEQVLAPGAHAELERCFRRRLHERRGAELARRQNLVGPHRDDIELVVEGRDLRRFGSQGQCRAAALALKMAQAEFIASRRNDRPVVVLDDVFAEFDETRARTLWDLVCRRYQTFLAVPRQSDLLFGGGDAVFRVERGRVRPDA